MNKHGQTLVSFVIIVPTFVLLLAFVVDTGLMLKETTKLKSTTKTILISTYNRKEETNYNKLVESLYKENDIPVDNLEIHQKNSIVRITNHYEIESIFGKIIGIKNYQIKNTMEAQKTNDKIEIKKE